MAKKKFYGVKSGVTPGVYEDWDSCKKQVDGFSGAEYKSFPTRKDAEAFVNGEKTTQEPKAQETKVPTMVSVTSDKPYAFVDGSFNEAAGVYGYGGFLCVGDTKYPLMGAGCKSDMVSMRNVAGEVSGAMAAVKKAEELGLREMTMFYDYMGIEKWATKSWKTNKSATQDYANFMNPENRSVQIEFQHVKGHSGVEGNEMADVMAKTAVGIPLTKKQQELYDSIDGIDAMKKPNNVRPVPTIGSDMSMNDVQYE